MITAILCTYWKERYTNAETIVNALLTGSVVPDKIVIFNNNFELDYSALAKAHDRVEVVNSSENLGHRARFTFALSIPSDYYFFIDDDMAPQKRTIENFMAHADPDCCLSFWGKKTKSGEYRKAESIAGHTLKEPMDVDMVVGRGSFFCSFNALVNMLVLEKELRLHPEFENGREADIELSMANNPKVIPVLEENGLTEIGQKGVGMNRAEGHYLKREAITRKIYEIKNG